MTAVTVKYILNRLLVLQEFGVIK